MTVTVTPESLPRGSDAAVNTERYRWSANDEEGRQLAGSEDYEKHTRHPKLSESLPRLRTDILRYLAEIITVDHSGFRRT